MPKALLDYLKQLIRFISENRPRITDRWIAHFRHAEYKKELIAKEAALY